MGRVEEWNVEAEEEAEEPRSAGAAVDALVFADIGDDAAAPASPPAGKGRPARRRESAGDLRGPF